MTRGPSPFVVSVVELRRTPGTQRHVEITAPLSGLTLSSAHVPDAAELAASLALEMLVDGRLTAIGRVEAPWEGNCRRCLTTVAGVAIAEVREVFEAHADPDGETYRLDVDRVDLEPMVRDAVLLALPLAPLCSAECPGPDPERPVVTEAGADEGDAEPPEATLDPRWATLREMRFE